MITTISEDGVLTIRPLNELESFALKSWLESFNKKTGCSLEILSLKGGLNEYAKVNPPKADAETNDNLINVNKDRVSKNGGGLIPSDEDVFEVVRKFGNPINSKQISNILSHEKESQIKTFHITNSLGRLVKRKRLLKNPNTKPITWMFKKPKSVEEVLYGTDQQRIEFSKEIGYKTIDEAVSDIGTWEFEKQFKEYLTSKC